MINKYKINVVLFLICFIHLVYGLKWCKIDDKRIKCFADDYNGKCAKGKFVVNGKRIVVEDGMSVECDIENDFEVVNGNVNLKSVLKTNWGETNCGVYDCLWCTYGWYECTSCDSGKYLYEAYETGYKQCVSECPSGTGSSDGICQPCSSGKYGSGGSCKNCPKGKYSSTTG